MFSTRTRKRLRRIFSTRLLKISRWVLITLAILQGAYLVFANVALDSDALRDRLRENQGFAIEYRRAWTIVPTLFHTRGLGLRAQHDALQWSLSFERCRFRIHLWVLLARKLRVSGIRGDGGAARVRPRLEPVALVAPRTSLLPPIRGYASPPMRDPIPSPPPNPDAKVWRVELADAELALREVWLAEYHYLGDGHASWRQMSGIVIDGPQLRLGREVALARSQVESYRGTIQLGTARLFDQLRAKFSGVIHRFEVDSVDRPAFLSFLSGAVVVEARLPELRTANYYLAGHARRAKLLGGHGALHADLRMQRGVEQPGSRLRLSFEDLVARLGPLEVAVPSSVELATWKVAIVGGRPLGRLDSRIDALHISAPALQVRPAIAKSIRLTLETRTLDHSVLPSDLAVAVELPSVAVPDLRLLNVLWPGGAGVRVTAGSATAQASLRAGGDRANGKTRISMTTHGLAVRIGDATIRGRVIAEAHASEIELRTRRAALKASLEIRDATASPGSRKPWWGKVRLSSGRLRLARPFSWTSAVRAQVLHVRPLYDHIARELEVPSWTRAFGRVEDLSLSGRVSARASELSLRDLEARLGDYEIRAVARRSRGRTRAALLVTLGAFSIGLSLNGNEKDLIIVGASPWFQKRRGEIAPPPRSLRRRRASAIAPSPRPEREQSRAAAR